MGSAQSAWEKCLGLLLSRLRKSRVIRETPKISNASTSLYLQTTIMPRKARKTRQELREQEGRIECAINDLKNGKICKVQEASRIYNVPPSTLRDRMKGHQSQPELRNQNHRISLLQEEALIAWIVSLDICGAAPRPFQVREMAQIILDAATSTPSLPIGNNWVTEFTKRRLEIKTRFAWKINCQGALCEDPRIIS